MFTNEEELKKYIRELKFEDTPRELHKQQLQRLLLDKLAQPDQISVSGKEYWRRIVKSRIAKVCAAAAILMGIGFFSVYEWGDRDEMASQPILQEVRSPAELTTMGALRFAYCRGGMEMVEKLCDQAITRSGPRPAEISRWDYF